MRERDPGLWPLEPSRDPESPLLEALTAQSEGLEGTLRALKRDSQGIEGILRTLKGGLSGSLRDSKGP